MTAACCAFQKYERLKKAQDIDTLFQNGKAFSILPIKVLYAIKEQSTASATCKVAFSAPKKLFRKSVDRQCIKRHLREAYRLNKASFIEALPPSISIQIMFLYVQKPTPDKVVEWNETFKKILTELLRKINSHEPSSAAH
jgi:ribonuclease P protein component